MLVRVRYKDGRIDLVPSQKLQELIMMSEIEQFERSAGWVTLGEDPVRSTIRGTYAGSERRIENLKRNI
jgi:putative N-acetylmannosamine-6-phosphate epimerase